MRRNEKTRASLLRSAATAFVTATFVVVSVKHVPGVKATATPKSMQEIFIGRCAEYQDVVYPEAFVEQQKNCTELWQLFLGAFEHRDPCDVPPERYDAFVAAADHEMDTKDKVMYWSGSVYPLVYEYTADRRRYVSIRDILSGYVIANVEAWCGHPDSPGFNSDECPSSCSSGAAPATPTYWMAISRMFALKVEGHIHVLLNGSSGSAFRNQSTFAQYELHYLEPDRNPLLTVFLIHNVEGWNNLTETCSNGSMVSLRSEVERKQIKYECVEDPIELTYFQCVDHVNSQACAHLAVNGAPHSHLIPTPAIIKVFAAFMLAFYSKELLFKLQASIF